MLTGPLITISHSQAFLLKKMSSLCRSYSHFFCKNISVYAIFNDQSFNNTLADDIVSLNNWVQIFFLYLHENIYCGYSFEAPHPGAFDRYPQCIFSLRIKKKSILFD